MNFGFEYSVTIIYNKINELMASSGFLVDKVIMFQSILYVSVYIHTYKLYTSGDRKMGNNTI